MDDPELRDALAVPSDQRIVALVHLGEAAEVPPPKPRTPAAEKTTWLPCTDPRDERNRHDPHPRVDPRRSVDACARRVLRGSACGRFAGDDGDTATVAACDAAGDTAACPARARTRAAARAARRPGGTPLHGSGRFLHHSGLGADLGRAPGAAWAPGLDRPGDRGWADVPPAARRRVAESGGGALPRRADPARVPLAGLDRAGRGQRRGAAERDLADERAGERRALSLTRAM